MNGPNDGHIKGSGSEGERQVLYAITYMQDLKSVTNESICKTENDMET